MRRGALPALNLPPAASDGQTVVAAFDFDGTLTRGDTLLPFLRLLLGWPGLLWALLRCAPWLLAYALRLTSNHRAKARLLRVCLRGRGVAELQALALAFVTDPLARQWRIDALERLRQHQRDGHRCVIVSASPEIYLRAAADHLGVADLLCTRLEVRDGRLSGEMLGVNCHGEEKLRRLRAWLSQALPGVQAVTLYAYGDSPGDLALLGEAHYAFYRGRPWARPDSIGSGVR